MVIQFINRAGDGALEGFEEDILSGDDLYLLKVGSDGVEGDLGVVVLEREVAQPHVAQLGVPVPLQQFAAHIVRLVSAGAEDTLLEVSGIRAVEQHVLVVVGLDDEVVGRTDIRFHLGVDGSAVGHEHKTLPEVIDAVTEAVGRVVLDAEGVDAHAEQFPLFPFVEITPAGSQFLAHTVVPVDTLVDGCGGVDRQADAFAEGAYSTDMVGVVVGDEHTHDVLEVKAHLA